MTLEGDRRKMNTTTRKNTRLIITAIAINNLGGYSL